MGIRDRPISPRSPWQNPYAERLIGTLRRDCLDHILIFGERHLLRILSLLSIYYNESRTHLGLCKDTPLGRGPIWVRCSSCSEGPARALRQLRVNNGVGEQTLVSLGQGRGDSSASNSATIICRLRSGIALRKNRSVLIHQTSHSRA
jgi:hypothetical protein